MYPLATVEALMRPRLIGSDDGEGASALQAVALPLSFWLFRHE